MLHAANLMPLLPLAGFVVLAAFGRRLGDPLAGWVGTLSVAGSFVAACVAYAGLLSRPAGAGREVRPDLVQLDPGGRSAGEGCPAGRPTLDDHGSLRHLR